MFLVSIWTDLLVWLFAIVFVKNCDTLSQVRFFVFFWGGGQFWPYLKQGLQAGCFIYRDVTHAQKKKDFPRLLKYIPYNLW